MHDPAFAAALSLATGLREKGLKIVFAESCTAGLASATLARIPGISEHHCGSAVVYRLDTKHEWLGVSNELLENPGPVSSEVAKAMAYGVLKKTPEADIAAAITGHLGPNAPTDQDGLVWMAVARRTAQPVTITKAVFLKNTSREPRQIEAARLLLEYADSDVTQLPSTRE
jgi:nicotinamide-nucleotide amidase